MALSFQAKDPIVLDRELKVQKVSIPFTITHSATPGSKVIVADEPSILFLDTEGLNQITIAAGALQTGEVLPSLATPTDSTGAFAALLLIREPLSKVVYARLTGRGATSISLSCEVLAFTTGTGGGQSAVVNVRSGINLSTTDLNAVLELEYIVADGQ